VAEITETIETHEMQLTYKPINSLQQNLKMNKPANNLP